MVVNNCAHNKQQYQCKICYQEKRAMGKPTPGWHQLCGKLLKDCKCEPNEKLREILITIFTKNKQKYDDSENDSENDLKSEFYTCLLNQLDGIPNSIKLDHKFDRLKEVLYLNIMQDKSTLAPFDDEDLLEMCRWLNLIKNKEYAKMYAELQKQEKLPEEKKVTFVAQDGSGSQQENVINKKKDTTVVDNGECSKQINLPEAETIDSWLKNINLLQYCAGIKAYGFDDLADFQTVTEMHVEAMVNDPDVNMKKLHRRIFMEHWKERFGNTNCGDKRTFQQSGQSSTDQQLDTKKLKLVPSFDVNGTNDKSGENGNAADCDCGNVNAKNCDDSVFDCEDALESNLDDGICSDSQNIDSENCNAADSTHVNANTEFSNNAKNSDVEFDFDKPLIDLNFSAEKIENLLPPNKTVILADLLKPPDLSSVDCNVTFEQIKEFVAQYDSRFSRLEKNKLYSLNRIAIEIVDFRIERARQKKISDEQSVKRKTHQIKYEEALKCEDADTLLEIQNCYKLSFDMCNQKWIRRLSITECTTTSQQNLMELEFNFGTKTHIIKFRSEHGFARNPSWKLYSQTDAEYKKSGVNDEKHSMEIKINSLDQDDHYFTLLYELKIVNRRQRFVRGRQEWQEQQKLEKKFRIVFKKPEHNLFQDEKCYFPDSNFIENMDPSAAAAQKEHQYYVMACILARSKNRVCTDEVHKQMLKLKQEDELKQEDKP